MIFKIATIAGHKLTVPEMNRIKEANPRGLERVYDEIIRMGDPGNALFALRLILKKIVCKHFRLHYTSFLSFAMLRWRFSRYGFGCATCVAA